MRLRTPITLLVLLGIVVGAGWYGWQQFNQPFDNPFASSSACVHTTVHAGGRLHRDQVVVDVYNAGTRHDLAASTMEDLTQIGFLRGLTGNAPRRLHVPVVTILDSDPTSAQVRLVRRQFQGRVRVQKKPDLGKVGIDVVVGNGYIGLSKHAPGAITVRAAQDLCLPATSPATAG